MQIFVDIIIGNDFKQINLSMCKVNYLEEHTPNSKNVFSKEIIRIAAMKRNFSAYSR